MLAAPGADRFGLYGTADGISSGAHPQGPGQWPPPVGAPLVHVGSVTGGSGWVFLGLMRSPILVALLATGLIWYMAWAAVRWQAEPFVRQMARESGDPGVQATYGLPDDGAKGSSFTALQDYRQ